MPLVEPALAIRVPRRSYRSLTAIGPAVAAAAVVAVALMQVTSFGTPAGPSASVHSDAPALRADYTDRRLSKLFLQGQPTASGSQGERPAPGHPASD